MLLRSNPRSRVAGDLQPRNGVQIPGCQRIQAAVLRLSTARSWIPDARPDQGRTWSSRRRTSGAGDRRRWRRWLPTAGQLCTRTQSYPQGDEHQDAADLRAGNVRAGSAPHPPRRGPSGAGDQGVPQRHDGLYRRGRLGRFHGRIQHHLRNTELAHTSDRRAARQAGARAMDACGAPGATGRAPHPPSDHVTPTKLMSAVTEELNADDGESQKAYKVDLDGMSRVVSSLYALLDDSAPIAATSMI